MSQLRLVLDDVCSLKVANKVQTALRKWGSIQQIEVLDLSQCNLTDGEFSALLPILSEMSALKYINLSDNDIIEEGILSLVTLVCVRLKSVQTLDLEDNSRINIGGFNLICEIVEECESLVSLNLSGLLELKENVDGFACALKFSYSLRVLGIENCGLMETEFKSIISALISHDCNCKLRELRLGYNQLTCSEAAYVLKPLFTNAFKELSFLGLPAIVNMNFKNILTQKLKQKGREYSKRVSLTRPDVEEFVSSSRKTAYAYKNSFVNMVSESLVQNSTMRYLGLECNNLTDEDCNIISTALEINVGLKQIDFKQNYISMTGAMAIVLALGKNEVSMLEKIDLSCNNIDENNSGFMYEMIKNRNIKLLI